VSVAQVFPFSHLFTALFFRENLIRELSFREDTVDFNRDTIPSAPANPARRGSFLSLKTRSTLLVLGDASSAYDWFFFTPLSRTKARPTDLSASESDQSETFNPPFPFFVKKITFLLKEDAAHSFLE